MGTSLSSKSITSISMPESLKCQLAVKTVVEDQDLVAKNKETVKTKSVGELSAIGALSEIPIPDNIENIYKTITEKIQQRTEEKEAPERPSTPQSYKEKIYDTLPRSLREQQLLCATKLEEDQERQELTRTKSPTQLSQISSISDFPVPKPIEQLLQKKSEQEESDSPVPPPRKWRQEDIYDSIPASLKSELLVSHTTSLDPEEAAAKMEFVRTHTPAELGQIHSLSDIPIPDIIENLLAKKETTEPTEKEEVKEEEKEEKGPFKIYDSIPASLKSELLVSHTTSLDPEEAAAKMEVVKSKSVNELSQISSLGDFPIPDTIENFVKTLEKKQYGPAERKKKIKEMSKSSSTSSLKSQGMYATLPRSLKIDLAVKTVEQDQDMVEERKN